MFPDPYRFRVIFAGIFLVLILCFVVDVIDCQGFQSRFSLDEYRNPLHRSTIIKRVMYHDSFHALFIKSTQLPWPWCPLILSKDSNLIGVGERICKN